MEKLVYILWKRDGDDGDTLRDALRFRAAPALHHGGAKQIKVAVADSEVAAGAKLRIGAEPAKDALVSFWLDQSQERAACEAALAAVVGRAAGYLVVESCPIVNTDEETKPGERTPGFSLVSCIERRDDVDDATFIDRWYNVQRDTAIDLQSTFSYVRNEVVRPLTPDAPPWRAIVEEGFPIGALDDPTVFYDVADADDAAAELRSRQQRMVESCASFIALERISSHPMSEFRD